MGRLLQDASAGRPKAYIHVGAHKVASTYIQAAFCRLRSELAALGRSLPIYAGCSTEAPRCAKYFAGVPVALRRAREGVVPDPAVETQRLAITCGAPEGGSVETLRDTLRTTEGDVYLSAEGFDGLSLPATRYLADIFRDYDVRILMLYRRKLDHLLSWYTESMRHQRILSDQPTWLASLDLDAEGGLNLARMVHGFADVFGDASVTVASFDGLREARRNVVAFVLETFMEVPRQRTERLASQVASPAHVSPRPDLVGLWAFIQRMVLLGDHGSSFVPQFGWDKGAFLRCYLRRSAPLLRMLGPAWQCTSMASTMQALTARDLAVLRERPAVQRFFFDDGAEPAAASENTMCHVDWNSVDPAQVPTLQAAVHEIVVALRRPKQC